MKYVDTDVFIYWATDHPKHGQRATEILRHVELNEKAVTSALNIWLFHKVMRDTNGYSLRSFVDQISQMRNLKIVALDGDILARASDVMREKHVSEEVAVAAVVAKDRGADTIYSTNAEFDRTDLKRTF